MEAERQVCPCKTANLDTFVEYIHSVFNGLDVVFRFYDDRFTKLIFLNYIGHQRADAETVNIFVSGGKKYLKCGFKQSSDDENKGTQKTRKQKKNKKKIRQQDKGKGIKERKKSFAQDS